jgi:hypothetical protein
MKRDRGTYDSVRDKYDEFLDIQSRKPVLQRAPVPQRAFVPDSGPDQDMLKTVFAAVGVGISVMLLALSGYSVYVAMRWGAEGLTGASTGYAMVAFFLAVAGIGGIAATLNHNYRVLARTGAHH